MLIVRMKNPPCFHESHTSVAALDLAKEHSIVMLIFPPHCSHKLQPLDRSVYGPLKRYYNAACDNWMVSNPRPMTIYDIVPNVCSPYAQAFTKSYIEAGFKVAGIEPFNSEISSDDEYLASSVTDRPPPILAPSPTAVVTQEVASVSTNPVQGGVTEMEHTGLPSFAESQGTLVMPEQLKPFPKAAPRKTALKSRQQKTRILTDTPVRNEIRLTKENTKQSQKRAKSGKQRSANQKD